MMALRLLGRDYVSTAETTGGEEVTNSEFEKIYKLYFGTVYRYMLRLCQNRDIAEEITSETFFKAISNIDSFKGGSELTSWLCQIAKNSYYSHLRKSRNHNSIDDFSEKSDSAKPSVPELLETSDTAMRLYKSLHILDEPYKEVFMLRIFGELSFKQIGAIFGKSENWACVTYHRAKRKLQDETEENSQ